MREGDTIARLGGDEFGVLALDISDPSAILALAQKVQEVISHPRSVGGLELAVDASIGIALSPEHGTDTETLMRRADVAMYRSKETHAPTLYDSDHDDYSPARLGLVADLRTAIARHELIVEYQPQCDPGTGELHGVEALLRWQHPERGLLMPDEFMPLAEQSGMIRALTAYVLDRSLRQLSRWQAAGRALTVAVNISPRDLLDSQFPGEVKAVLQRWNVNPAALDLEITEKSAIADLPRTQTTLAAISGLGVRLAIDDFGTGNTSLAYLRKLPVDVLKIDRSLIMGMSSSDDDAAIVRSTIRLAHDLGLHVVAEGVESAECSRHLANLGCELAQGYHFGKAMPPEAIAHWTSVPGA